MGLKTSKYNFFFDSKDGYKLAYNAFTNSWARTTKEKFVVLKKILQNPTLGI